MREAVEGSVKETEQIRISSNLRDNEVYIRKQCENCADILVRPMRLGEDRKVDCLMVYIEVTVSNMMLDDSAIRERYRLRLFLWIKDIPRVMANLWSWVIPLSTI